MHTNYQTEKRTLRPFTRRGTATADGNIGGTTLVSLWDPAVPEGLNEGNDFWKDAEILILTGDMADQGREITGFVQATGVITVAPRFVNPNVSLLTVNSPFGDVVIDVADAGACTDGALLAIDAVAVAPAVVVADASPLRLGAAVIYDNTGASEAIAIAIIDRTTNILVLAAPLGAAYTVANGATVCMAASFIFDTANEEAVVVTGVDLALNQLTIAPLGIVAVAGYLIANNAAIGVSPTILDNVEFVLMSPTKTVDSGEHTNPEQWLQDNHWSTAAEVPIVAIGAGGEQALGAAVAAGAVRRIREVTARHQGTANTVISILDETGGNVILSFDVPAQSTVTWSSQDGRLVAAGLEPVVQTSDVTTAGVVVSAAGVEK